MRHRNGGQYRSKDEDVPPGQNRSKHSWDLQVILETPAMIQITPHMKILLAVEPVDFRKGIDGMAALCRAVLTSDPFSGCLFVFLNRRRTSIKILSYDGQGFWLCQKRLSKGKFNWWPTKGQGIDKPLDAHELQMLIWNGDPFHTQVAPIWRKIPA